MLAGSGALSARRGTTRLHAYSVIFATALVVVALDHFTKWLVVQNLALGQGIWPHAPLSITHVENRGAAFGLFPQFQWLYLIVAVIVVLYIVLAGHRFGTTWYRQVMLGFILGGAISNGVDRLAQGYVVDFINVHWWPVFNLADSAIVVGIVVTILTLGRHATPQEPSAT